ncbi:MAG TPA: ABC transporter permease subunit [Phycisphaerae bacterium]|nr:ABC transporter permease subunit [Phycisphaerae bacterium]HOI53848.1 ABC transporter permease subunit [Phycisphaerae bacterium]
MQSIAAISINTFREVVRQPVFILVLALAAAVLLLMMVVPLFGFADEVVLFKDLALHTSALAIVFLVALTAASSVAEELESKTVLALLAKPVARWQLLVGKFAGIVLALAAATAVLALLVFLTTYVKVYNGAMPAERHGAFSMSQSAPVLEFQAKMWNHAASTLPACVMILYRGAILAAVAVVLSAGFSRVLAVIVTFGLYLVGHLTEFLTDAVRHSTALVRDTVTPAAHLLPFLQNFDIVNQVSAAMADEPAFEGLWAYTGWVGLYTVGYVAFVLLVGTFLFNRREID